MRCQSWPVWDTPPGPLTAPTVVPYPRSRATYGSNWTCPGPLTVPIGPIGNSQILFFNTLMSFPSFSNGSTHWCPFQASQSIQHTDVLSKLLNWFVHWHRHLAQRAEILHSFPMNSLWFLLIPSDSWKFVMIPKNFLIIPSDSMVLAATSSCMFQRESWRKAKEQAQGKLKES